MPTILELCDAYDKAEKIYQSYYGGPVQPDPLERLIQAKKAVLACVREATGFIPRAEPWRDYQAQMNILAYFSAWHITRGGWKVALRDD